MTPEPPTRDALDGCRRRPRGRWCWPSASRWPSPASSRTSRSSVGRRRPRADRGDRLVAPGAARGAGRARAAASARRAREADRRRRARRSSGSRLGEAGHRVRLPVEVQPISAGVEGGLVGGVAMAVVALAYGLLVQGSLWYPINLLAAVAMPGMAQADVAELRAFNCTALVLGHHRPRPDLGARRPALRRDPARCCRAGTCCGAAWSRRCCGRALWAAAGRRSIPALNARIDWAWFVVSQIAFGLAAGFVVARAQPVATMQTWPLPRAPASRPGVERDRERSR